ncbi:unnamed protein product [Tuber aestivum]|uniref:Uncharacterized protein n=1 Tax=Tuber aestivum TaxID=59557 RepID=A0A292Q6D4_9PEZI|nr:unnamed protein product [Tuber aestivum]
MTGKKGGGIVVARSRCPVVNRLNEMLRFLKYGEGQHFGPRCDAAYSGNGEGVRQKSFLTMDLYLTDIVSLRLSGGSTRFWSPDRAKLMNIGAKRGRVLIFQ